MRPDTLPAGLQCIYILLQVSEPTFEEFNGFPGKNNFVASPKLAQRLATQIAKPFMFDYVSGHVSNIHASSGVSDTVVNIVRGILSFFHVTIKATQRIYELEEASPATVIFFLFTLKSLKLLPRLAGWHSRHVSKQLRH